MREPTPRKPATRRPSRSLSSVRGSATAQGVESTNVVRDVMGWLNPQNPVVATGTREAVHATGRYYKEDPRRILMDLHDTIDPRASVTRAAESGDWGTVALVAAGMLPIPGAKAIPAAARAARAGAGAARRATTRALAPRTVAHAAPPGFTVGDAIDPEVAAKLRAMGSSGQRRSTTGRAPRTNPPSPPKPDAQYSSPAGANKAWQRYVTSLTDHNNYRRSQGLDPIPMADRDAINGRRPLSPGVDPQESRGVNTTRAQVRRAEADMTAEEMETVRKGQAEAARRRASSRRQDISEVLPQSNVRAETGGPRDPYAKADLPEDIQKELADYEATLPRTPKTNKLTAGSKKRLEAFRSQLLRARDMNDNAMGLPRGDTPAPPRPEPARPTPPRALGELVQEARQAQRFKEAGVDLARARSPRRRQYRSESVPNGTRRPVVGVDENGNQFLIAGADDVTPGALDPKAGLINKAELDRQKQAIREGKDYETERDVRLLMDESHRNRLAGQQERTYAPRESTRSNLPDNNYDRSERGTRLNPKRRPGSRKLRPRRGLDPVRQDGKGRPLTEAEAQYQLRQDRARMRREQAEEAARRARGGHQGLDGTPPRRADGRPWREERGEFDFSDTDPRHPDFDRRYARIQRDIAAGKANYDQREWFEQARANLRRVGGKERSNPNSGSAMWGETQTSVQVPGGNKPASRPKPKPKTSTAEKPSKPETQPQSKPKAAPKKPAAAAAPADTAAMRARNMEKYRKLEADGTIPKGSVARFEAGESWNSILSDAPKPKAGKPKATKPKAEAAESAEAPKPAEPAKASAPTTATTPAPPPPADELAKAGVKKPKAKKGKGKEKEAEAPAQAAAPTSSLPAAPPVAVSGVEKRKMSKGKKLLVGGAVVGAGAGALGWTATQVRRAVGDSKPAESTKPAAPAATPTSNEATGSGKVFTSKTGKKYRLDAKGRRISLAEYDRRQKYRQAISSADSNTRQRIIDNELQRRARYRKGLGAKEFGSNARKATRWRAMPESMPLATWRSMSEGERRRYKQKTA